MVEFEVKGLTVQAYPDNIKIIETLKPYNTKDDN